MTTPRTGWRGSPDGRGTIDILWACLFTVFTCCWTSSHPNIVKPGTSWAKLVLDRIFCLVVAAIAPEILVFIALNEWSTARSTCVGSDVSHNWSIVHGYYALMGGYALRLEQNDSDEQIGYLDSSQIQNLLRLGLVSEFSILTRNEIKDKGKSDGLVKTFALGQILWLVAQCFARVAQHLPITTLELSTIAYIPCALLVFFLWWHKPYNIREPTILTLSETVRPWTSSQMRVQNAKSGAKTNTEMGSTGGYTPIIPVQSYRSLPMVCACVASIQSAFFLVRCWSRLTLIVGLFYLIFGGIHLAAWNFSFPSAAEQMAWRVCSIITMVSIPVSWMLTRFVLIVTQGGISDEVRYGMEEPIKVKVSLWGGKSIQIRGFEIIQIIGAAVYAIARLYLVVEVFIYFRSAPEAVYKSVNWVDLIPHV